MLKSLRSRSCRGRAYAAKAGAWKLSFVGLCLMLLPMCGLAAPASMRAELDRDTAAVGESVTLTLTFEGVSPKAPPNLPALPNVQANYSGQSSSFTIVNNETSRSVSFTYTLTLTQPGDIIIPAMQAQVDGQVVSSQPL